VFIFHIVVFGLKSIREYIAGAMVSLDSIPEPRTDETAFQKLFFILSRDNHQDINLLNREIGLSHNKTSVHKNAPPVINVFFRNHIFLFVKNLNNP
jgi:hypothetical protein